MFLIYSFNLVPIEKVGVKEFLRLLDEDRILHFFTIWDLRYEGDKTEVWIALRNREIQSYLLEYDKKIVHTHGTTESVKDLLSCIDLKEVVFVIEPHHLKMVEEFFEIVEPADSSSKNKITKFLIMKVDKNSFKPLVRHYVKRLKAEDLDEVSEHLGEEQGRRVREAVKTGIAFGAYQDETLASFAAVTEIITDLALIRGVYTSPPFRSKGLATSAVSALVKELFHLSKETVLWVSEDNFPAIRVYEKIGFKETGKVLFGFKARKKGYKHSFSC